MSWKVSVFASLEDHKIQKPAIVGVRSLNKKNVAVDDDHLYLHGGSAEPTGASARIDIAGSSDRSLDNKAKKLSLIIRDEETGIVYDIPTDGEYEVEEVF